MKVKNDDNDGHDSPELLAQVEFMEQQAEVAKKYADKVVKENRENTEKLVEADRLSQLDLKLKK